MEDLSNMKAELIDKLIYFILGVFGLIIVIIYAFVDIFYHDYLKYLQGLFFTLGIIMLSKLFWMVYYEWRYSKGEEYLRCGKKCLKDKHL